MDIFHGEGLITLIKSVGYVGIFAIVFAESGILIGAFLPGDSLLFTAGFLASQNFLNIWILIPTLFIAAVLGDNVGYAFGRKVGPKIFKKKDSLLFHQDNLIKAEMFYEKHGPITVMLARWMPFIRTFAPIVAGVGKMNYKTFFFYNVLGGFIWTASLPLAGYYLGQFIPDIDKYLLPIIGAIIFISALPPIYHIIKEKIKLKKK